MNIIDYLKLNGDKTFKELPFNEVDVLILNLLHYVDYGVLLGDDKKGDIEELYQNYKKLEHVDKSFVSDRQGYELLEEIYKYKRFKKLKIRNYVYSSDEKHQFSALMIRIKFGVWYVNFKGTDALLSGWEEDLRMAYEFPTPAQKLAFDYLNKHFTFRLCKLIVGGHSKGGHLALVGSMYSNFLVRWKIKNIYSNDGQGLRIEEFESKEYQRIKNKYIHIIPNNSFVGVLLHNDTNYRVIRSNKPGLFAHMGLSWQVDGDHFVTSTRTRFSKVSEKGFEDFLSKYTYEEVKLLIDGIFQIIHENNITTVPEFQLKKAIIIGMLKKSKEVDPRVGRMFLDLLRSLGKANFEYPLFGNIDRR